MVLTLEVPDLEVAVLTLEVPDLEVAALTLEVPDLEVAALTLEIPDPEVTALIVRQGAQHHVLTGAAVPVLTEVQTGVHHLVRQEALTEEDKL
jgi:hypothetical protein